MLLIDFDEMFSTAVRQLPMMRKASSKDEGTKKFSTWLEEEQNVPKNQKTNKYFIKRLIFQTLTNGGVVC